MKGIMPEEMEVWYILPAIRRECAKIMVQRGLSQREIAKKLFITEAAVSHYIKGKRGDIEFPESIQKEINQSVTQLLQNGTIIQEFENLCRKIRASGFLCIIHKKYGITPKECEKGEIICLNENGNATVCH